MNRPVSFINERTAEYVLVPKLAGLLGASFESVVPVFYWKSREGSAASLRLHGNRGVRAIAMFARRPKTTTDDGSIYMKINEAVVQFAARAQAFGIPTVAAMPLARTVWDLPSSQTVLVDLASIRAETVLCVDDGHGPVAPLLTAGCLRKVADTAIEAPWSSLTEAMSELCLAGERHRWFPGAGYKPVHFLVTSR